jgi:hypothetical protein
MKAFAAKDTNQQEPTTQEAAPEDKHGGLFIQGF